MDNQRFASILEIKVAGLVEAYMQSARATLKDAIKTVYNSRLYQVLEREETKMWHHSSALLLDCIKQELASGCLEFPDE